MLRYTIHASVKLKQRKNQYQKLALVSSNFGCVHTHQKPSVKAIISPFRSAVLGPGIGLSLHRGQKRVIFVQNRVVYQHRPVDIFYEMHCKSFKYR